MPWAELNETAKELNRWDAKQRRPNLKGVAMSGATKTAKTIELKLSVVGLGFRMKRDVRKTLAGVVENAVGGIHIKLDREQENRYDINAIRVTHDGAGPLRGQHLGYLRADVAAQIAPLWDDGLLVPAKTQMKLTALDAADDWKSGTLTVVFRDKRPKSQ